MSDNNDFNFDVYGQENGNSGNENIDNNRTDLNEHHNGDTNGNGSGQVESSTGEPMSDDRDLFELKQHIKGMDEEAARLIQLQSEMEQQMKSTNSPTTSFGVPFPTTPMSAEEKMEADQRSIYVGNVDYSATAQELEAHFHGCGSINRVTILCDKFSGHPKGFAYVEFGDKDSVQTAMALDDSLFKGRQIKVVGKRTNRPGVSTTDRVPRGGMRGGMIPAAAAAAAYGFMPTGRGRGFGMARGGGFNPYMRSMRGRVVKGGRGFHPYYAPY